MVSTCFSWLVKSSVMQWHALMQGTEFWIERIIGLDNTVGSIIEAVLRE